MSLLLLLLAPLPLLLLLLPLLPELRLGLDCSATGLVVQTKNSAKIKQNPVRLWIDGGVLLQVQVRQYMNQKSEFE